MIKVHGAVEGAVLKTAFYVYALFVADSLS
jgi:hypothetical protein